MARTLLDMFIGRKIEIYEDADMVRDLLKLQIHETITGYTLRAKRDETGHADKAVALSIVLAGCMRFGGAIVDTLNDPRSAPESVVLG